MAFRLTIVPAKVTGPAFEEDLSTARLQVEELTATIALLKEQLKSERKLACEKLDLQRNSGTAKLQAQEEKYKAVVKRHQKFIEQLIAEKTELTEKCNCLAQRVKNIEGKMQRDLRATADRHAVELQRAKERCAAAEKIKRERWIEARTTRIKVSSLIRFYFSIFLEKQMKRFCLNRIPCMAEGDDRKRARARIEEDDGAALGGDPELEEPSHEGIAGHGVAGDSPMQPAIGTATFGVD